MNNDEWANELEKDVKRHEARQVAAKARAAHNAATSRPASQGKPTTIEEVSAETDATRKFLCSSSPTYIMLLHGAFNNHLCNAPSFSVSQPQ